MSVRSVATAVLPRNSYAIGGLLGVGMPAQPGGDLAALPRFPARHAEADEPPEVVRPRRSEGAWRGAEDAEPGWPINTHLVRASASRPGHCLGEPKSVRARRPSFVGNTRPVTRRPSDETDDASGDRLRPGDRALAVGAAGALLAAAVAASVAQRTAPTSKCPARGQPRAARSADVARSPWSGDRRAAAHDDCPWRHHPCGVVTDQPDRGGAPRPHVGDGSVRTERPGGTRLRGRLRSRFTAAPSVGLEPTQPGSEGRCSFR